MTCVAAQCSVHSSQSYNLRKEKVVGALEASYVAGLACQRLKTSQSMKISVSVYVSISFVINSCTVSITYNKCLRRSYRRSRIFRRIWSPLVHIGTRLRTGIRTYHMWQVLLKRVEILRYGLAVSKLLTVYCNKKSLQN